MNLIDGILPVFVATAEAFDDRSRAKLFPAEEAVIRQVVERRRREFTTVRHCARQALADLGYAPVSILPGAQREPQWPAGVVGSMTHCDGYRAAALARDCDAAALGIDAEPHLPLPEGLLALIARPVESSRLSELQAQHPHVCWDRLTFSAKESVFKAWFPLTRQWLGFEHATLTFHPGAQVFDVELHKSGLAVAGRPITRLTGRWIVESSLIITSVVIAV